MPHIHKDIDYVVGVYIVHNKKVLLGYHRKANSWLSIGGHIELDEDPIEAVHREVKEETGLEIELVGQFPTLGDGDSKSLLPPRFMNIHPIGPDGHRHVCLFYFARPTGGCLTRDDREHAGLKWWNAIEIHADFGLYESTVLYACTALAEVSRLGDLIPEVPVSETVPLTQDDATRMHCKQLENAHVDSVKASM